MEQRKPTHLIVSLLCLTLYCGSHTLREKSRLLSRAVKALPPCPCVSPHLLLSCYSSASHITLPARPLHTLCLLPGAPSPLLSPTICPSPSLRSRFSSSLLLLGEVFAEPSPHPNAIDHSRFRPHSTRYPGTLHCRCLSVHLSPRWSPGRTGLCLSESPGE